MGQVHSPLSSRNRLPSSEPLDRSEGQRCANYGHGRFSDRNRRAQVQETIGRRKLEDEWNRFLSEMRGEAFVDVRVGKQADPEAAPAAPANGG